jgi:hypothetical protein
MKKMIVACALLVLAVFSLGGCAMVAAPVNGCWYTGVQGPLMVDDQDVASSKVGTSTMTSFFGVIAVGDASIDAAKKSAGISKVSHVDFESTSVLGIFSKWTTVVYGE